MSDDKVTRLKNALKAADAAGNTDDAMALAKALRSAMQAPVDTRPESNMLEGVVDKVTQGMAVGFGDEMTALEAAILGKTPDGQWFNYDQSWGDRYDAALEAERQQQARFRDEQPVAAIGSEVAGGVASALATGGLGLAAKGTTTAGKVGYGAAEGAGFGAAYGFGSGEGGAKERGKQAIIGGALGGAAGGAMTAAGQGIGRAIANHRANKTAKIAGATPDASRVAARALEADGPREVVANIQRGGPGAMLADGGPALAAQLDGAVNASVAGASVANRNMSARVNRAAAELTDTFDNAFGKPGVSQSRDMIVYGDKTNPISLMYRKAYSTPIDYAAPAGRNIEGLMARVPKSEIDAANRLIRMDPDAVDVKQILAKELDDGTLVYSELPTVQQIDYVTRALNGVADANIGKGALGGNTTTGRAYGNLASRIRAELKESVPAYGVALNAAGTEIGKRQAKEIGLNIMRSRVTIGEVSDALKDMPAAEKAKVREGVRLYLDHITAQARRNATNPDIPAKEFAKGLGEFSNRLSREKLMLILGPKQAAGVARKVDELWRSLELQARVARGSQTAMRNETVKSVEDITSPGVVAKVARGEPLQAGRKVMSALMGVSDDAIQANKDKVWRDTARLLTQEQGPKAVYQAEQLVSSMLKRGATDEQITAALQAANPTAAIGGTVGGQTSVNLVSPR